MKTIFIAAIAAQVTLASASSVAISNGLNEDVTDPTGTLLANGSAVVAIGYFSVLDVNITDFSSFVQVGADIQFDPTYAGLFHQTENTIDFDHLGIDSAAIGESVYLVVGDNTTNISESTNWLVFKTTQTYAGNPTPSPSTVALGASQGTLLKGNLGTFKGFDGTTDAFSLVTVPEPSSVALLGLGATALLFRRRK